MRCSGGCTFQKKELDLRFSKPGHKGSREAIFIISPLGVHRGVIVMVICTQTFGPMGAFQVVEI